MKSSIAAIVCATLVSFTLSAQQKNTLLDAAFWKTSPTVDAVKAEIAKGNSATEFNPSSFDATVLAINNNAPAATIKFLVDLPGNGVDKVTHDSRIYLHWATSRGNLEVIEYLLSKGADINAEDSRGSTPLVFGLNSQTNTSVFETYFKAGLDPKKKYRDGANLLLLVAANDKDFMLTEYFISKGMSLKDVDDNGNTAFNYAVRSGNVALLKTLLTKGVKYTDNALIMAAQGTRTGANALEIYQYLVDELKINPAVTSKTGETVLHALVRRPNQTTVINYFLDKGVDVNKADNDGNTPIMNASSTRDLATVELLLPKVKNINAVNAKGESAFTFAVRSGSSDIASLLLKNGADVNVKDKEGNTLAYYLVQSYRPVGAPGMGGSGGPAAGQGQQQDEFALKLKMLQDKGLNFATVQKDGNTLYHVAIAKHDLELLKKLAGLNIDVNAKNKEGITVLHKAAMTSKDDAVLKYLISIGAKKDIMTEFDETAYTLAKENEFLAKKNVSVDFLK